MPDNERMDIRDAVDLWRKWVPLEGPAGFSRRIEISETPVRPWVEAYVGVIASQQRYFPIPEPDRKDAIEALVLLVDLERKR